MTSAFQATAFLFAIFAARFLRFFAGFVFGFGL